MEMDSYDLDDARLAAIAHASGGRYYHSAPTAERLAEDIRGSLVGLVEHQELSLSNTPLFFSTYTTVRSPESSTASLGIASLLPVATDISTFTNIPGFRISPGFSTSSRTFNVLVVGSTVGSI